jgi:hypothetical protein
VPSYVVKCESCGGLRPFLVQEGEISELQKKNPIQRHCPTCRAMTNWALAFREQRVRQSDQGEGGE